MGRLAATGTPWDRAIMVPIQAVWHVHGMETGHAEDHDHDHDHDHEEHAGDEHAHDNHAHDDHTHEAHGFDADAPLAENLAQGDLPGVPAILVNAANNEFILLSVPELLSAR